jgi:hypothetical protein
VLGVLTGEPLVGGGGVLVPLGTGGVCEISDCVSLGGVNEPSPLLPGANEPGDGPGLTGAPLDGPGVLGWEAGDGTGDGPGLVGDGDSAEATDPAEPTDPGEKLGNGGGDPLGGGGTSTELSMVLASLGVSDVGLVDAADGWEVGENEGTVTLDGPVVDDAGGVEPELARPDGGDVGLLPGVDVGDVLGVDGAPLVDGAEGCELGAGLPDSPRLPDVGEPDACEPDVGLVLDGSTLVGDVDGPLLGAPDDGADWLGALDNKGLASDEPAGLAESPEPGDGGEPETGLVLDGESPLPDAGEPLLGPVEEGAGWLGALDATGLVEPPELADGGEGDWTLPLDGWASLEGELPDCCDTELVVGLDPTDGTLLLPNDDVAEALSVLAELINDDCDGCDRALCEATELPD